MLDCDGTCTFLLWHQRPLRRTSTFEVSSLILRWVTIPKAIWDFVQRWEGPHHIPDQVQALTRTTRVPGGRYTPSCYSNNYHPPALTTILLMILRRTLSASWFLWYVAQTGRGLIVLLIYRPLDRHTNHNETLRRTQNNLALQAGRQIRR